MNARFLLSVAGLAVVAVLLLAGPRLLSSTRVEADDIKSQAKEGRATEREQVRLAERQMKKMQELDNKLDMILDRLAVIERRLDGARPPLQVIPQGRGPILTVPKLPPRIDPRDEPTVPLGH